MTPGDATGHRACGDRTAEQTAPVSDASRVARAALSRVCEPDDRELHTLLDSVGPEAAWDELRRGGGSDELRGRVGARLAAARPEADLEAVVRLGGRLICPGEAEWPGGLADLRRPPIALWVRGAGRLDQCSERSVAVVGSRAASPYGGAVAGELAAGLGDAGWATASGGAYGIDAAVHRGSLAAGAPTIAVLACGVDVPYPRGHDLLFARIAEDGVIVSEWPPGCSPMRHRFLTRNRVIAALAPGTVVVEAAARSGALRTARDAMAIGRPLMAVPGPVTSAMSVGCHELIRNDGAVCVTRVEEVIEVVGRIGEDLADPRQGLFDPRDALSPDVRRVLDAVPKRQPATTSAIARSSGLPESVVRPALGALVAAALVEAGAGRYRLAS
jgi:DNA processing protein